MRGFLDSPPPPLRTARSHPARSRLLLPSGTALLALLAAPHLLFPWYSRRGTREEERRASLPGDEIVPQPLTGYTLGITIRAAPHLVWPWLVQMGQGRAGFYTLEWVENLLGMDLGVLLGIRRRTEAAAGHAWRGALA